MQMPTQVARLRRYIHYIISQKTVKYGYYVVTLDVYHHHAIVDIFLKNGGHPWTVGALQMPLMKC